MEDSATATLARYSTTSLPDARDSGESNSEFLAIYRESFDFVWKTVAGLSTGSVISVEDAVQDVWLVVARRLPDFRRESSPRTWLYAVAKNIVRNHRRLSHRKGGLEAFDETATPAEGKDEEQALHARAVWRDVQLFMVTLSEQQREVFLCRFLLEMGPREVATASGTPLLSVYAETRRLKSAFKRWHQSREDGSP